MKSLEKAYQIKVKKKILLFQIVNLFIFEIDIKKIIWISFCSAERRKKKYNKSLAASRLKSMVKELLATWDILQVN